MDIGEYNEDTSDNYKYENDPSDSSNADQEEQQIEEDTTGKSPHTLIEEGESDFEVNSWQTTKEISPANFVAGERRSPRQRRKPREWWKETTLSSVEDAEPLTFSAATKGEESIS